MNKLTEFNENLDTPLYCPSLLENLQQKHQYFEVPGFDSKITRQIILTTGYNEIYYKLHIFSKTFFKILHLMMTLYHKSKSLQNFFRSSFDSIIN